MNLVPVATAMALLGGCAQPRVNEAPDLGTLSDNPLPTDSVYGTPPDPIPTVPPPPATASPTGREPRLIWTPARQATWDRMVAENHPRWQDIVAKCNRARSGSPAYGDRGLWCTLVFQMTGDVSAARVAWQVAAPLINNVPTNANEIRENFIENAIMFDWLYPALTDAERTQAIAGLNSWGNYALAIGTAQYQGGMRTGDSDALVGYYFGLAAADVATRGMTGHVDWLSATQTGGPGTLPVGGLRASGIDRSTARNTISEYIANRAAGGQWIESSDYDPGTVALLVMGLAAVEGAASPGDLDDIRGFVREAIDFNIHSFDENQQTTVQWGDVQHPREFLGRLYRQAVMLGLAAGTVPGTIESGEAMGFLDALGQRYGWTGYNSIEPWARFYLTYDPYVGRASWTLAPSFFAQGRGHLLARTSNSLFSGMMIPPSGVDHSGLYLSDFQLYRNGEWVVTHPLGYAGESVQGEAVNGLLLAGLSGMDRRSVDRVDSGTEWWAITGSSDGQLYASGYYNPPPSFLNQWQRTVVYLRRGGVDHVVTVDRVQMQDPQALANFSRYRATDQARIQSAPGLLQWIIHAPVAPQASGSGRWSWQTAGGQSVVVSAVGAAPQGTVIDERTLWNGSTSFSASELKYQLRLVPAFTGGSTVLRNVVTVGETNPTITSSGDTITIDGVQVIVTPTGVQVIG